MVIHGPFMRYLQIEVRERLDGRSHHRPCHYPGVVEANVYGVLVPGHDGRAGCAALHLEHQ